MLEKNNLRKFIKFLIAIISIVGLFLIAKEIINNVDSISKISQSAGIFGPIILILLISLGILFSPIPSVLFIVVAGYLYGTWMGALYSYMGHLFAATCAFAFFKSFEIKNEGKRYIKYKQLVEKNRKILYILYAIPILPISITTILSASSKTEWKKFIEIILISFIPAIIFFSFFGDRISNRNLIAIGILALIIITTGLIITKIIRKNRERIMNGYPSRLKIPWIKNIDKKISHNPR